MRHLLKESKKIVIKAGTSILSTRAGKISTANLKNIGNDIAELMKSRKQVALVTSGAIAFGMEACNLKNRPKEMSKLQACAAIGQSRLMQTYDQFFATKKIKTGQLLLTRDGLEKRKRFLSARNTLFELLKMRVLPIINENDTVATDEIGFGDNDILSVHVAHLMQADLLVLLSDVDGFYLQDKSRIREVTSEADIDQRLVKHLSDKQKQRTVGGMRAKLDAAKVAMRLGVPLLIVNGHEPRIIAKVIAGEDVGTLFHACMQKSNARKNWIAYSAARKGSILVDEGAREALSHGKRSLLPGGIAKVKGNFERGDVVELSDLAMNVFGRGVALYSSRDLNKIAGKQTNQIETELGYKHQDEVIHRNDMVIWS